jgi:hypothetical protein
MVVAMADRGAGASLDPGLAGLLRDHTGELRCAAWLHDLGRVGVSGAV